MGTIATARQAAAGEVTTKQISTAARELAVRSPHAQNQTDAEIAEHLSMTIYSAARIRAGRRPPQC